MGEQLTFAGLAVLAILSIVDVIAYYRFWPRFYALGPAVFRESTSETVSTRLPVGAAFETGHGLFLVDGSGRTLLRERQLLFDRRKARVRGMIDSAAGETRIETRLSPVAVFSFIVCAMYFAVRLVFAASIEGVFALLFLGFLGTFSVVMAQERSWLLLREYLDHCEESRPYA